MPESIVGTVQEMQAALATAQSRIEHLEKLLQHNQILVPPLERAPNPVYQAHQTTQDSDRLHLYEALIHNALDGVVVADLNGNLIYSNPAFRQMSGFGDKAEQSMIVEYFEPEDWEILVNQLLPELHQKGMAQTQLRYRRYDGSHFIGQVSAFIVYNSHQEPNAQAVLVRDITDQVEAEKQRASLQQDLIEAQQNLLRELSTPLLPLADDVLLMPIIGEVDMNRAEQLMDAMLNGVARHQASIVIIDITGVKFADTHIANILLQIARAAQLLGTKVIVSGIGPEMAQTFVSLDTSLNEILTLNSLQSSITYAFNQVRQQKSLARGKVKS